MKPEDAADVRRSLLLLTTAGPLPGNPTDVPTVDRLDELAAMFTPATHGWGHDREDRTLWYLPINPESGSDDGPLDGRLERTTTKANMVGSELLNGRHSPVLDLDFEARLVPSSSPGHYHLFLDGLELDPAAYEALLDALVAAKVIQAGFRRRFIESGTTLARIRRDKTPGEPATGPIVVTTPGEAEKF